MDSKSASEGINTSRNQAHAVQRGFLYQAVVASIEWIDLDHDQVLWLERIEDIAVHSPAETTVIQVKDRSRGTTLRDALPFLNRAAKQIHQAGRAAEFKFVYISTSKAALEDQPSERIGKQPLLNYWNDARGTKRAYDIVPILRTVAAAGSSLEAYLASASDDDVVNSLVNCVVWATERPRSQKLEEYAAEALARFVEREFGQPGYVGRGMVGVVVHEVTRRSALPAVDSRALTALDLIELVRRSLAHPVDPATFRSLARAAAQVMAIPTEVLTERLRSSTQRLRQARFFSELKPQEIALALANQARAGGSLELAHNEARIDAIAWAARVIFVHDVELCASLLDEAKALGISAQTLYVEALLEAKSDQAAALRLLANERSLEAQTVRFAICNLESPVRALEWVRLLGLQPENFDADGQYMVLNTLLIHKEWEEVESWTAKIDSGALSECLALRWLVAFSLIALVVPASQKEEMLSGAPILTKIDLNDFPHQKKLRHQASDLFRSFSNEAIELGLLERADSARMYALWIELQSKSTAALARSEVAELCKVASGARPAFKWLPLGLAIGVVEARDVFASAKQEALTLGGLDYDGALALFSALIRLDWREWLAEWSNLDVWLSTAIESFARALLYARAIAEKDGIEAAEQFLRSAGLSSDGLEEALYRLRQAHNAANHEVEEPKLSKDSPLQTKRDAVETLVQLGMKSDAADIAIEIFAETQTILDAEACSDLLIDARRYQEQIDLFRGSDLLQESRTLTNQLAWAFRQLGDWSASIATLDGSDLDFPARLKALADLHIRSLNWGALHVLLMSGRARLEELDAPLLRQCARWASVLDDHALSRDYITAAIERSPQDADVLFQGYLLATRGRWEHSPQASTWISEAVRHPSPTGSVRAGTLEELVELIPQQQQKTKNLNEMITTGSLFLALACGVANRPITGLIVDGLERNARTDRPERRVILPLFSGGRAPKKTDLRQAFLDSTSLLTLQYLGILDRVLTSFEKVHIAHETGLWLFHDFEQLAFHQPSRVQDAKELVMAVLGKSVGVIETTRVPEARLVREVGVELAALLTEARAIASSGRTAVVVHPGPIHKVQSLGKENADLADEDKRVIVSSISLLDSLRAIGAVSSHTYEKAKATLRLSDEGLPWDRVVDLRGATVFLDSFALSILRSSDVLKRAQAAGVRVVIHTSAMDEAKQLMDAEATEGSARRITKDLVEVLRNGYEAGRVNFGTSLPQGDDDDTSPIAVAIKELFHVVGPVVVVADDRALNRYEQITSTTGSSHQVLSSLDLIDRLVEEGALSHPERRELLARFMAGGAVLVPVTTQDLYEAVLACQFRDGEIVEGYEARSIRESVQLVQLANVLQVQSEGRWLSNVSQAVREALAQLWSRHPDDAAVQSRAAWLGELARLSNFSQSFLGPFDAARVISMDALTIAQLVVAGLGCNDDSRDAYNTWLESQYLEALRRRKPRLFETVSQIVKQQVLEILTAGRRNDFDANPELVQRYMLGQLHALPTSIRSRLVGDSEVQERLGVAAQEVVHATTMGGRTYAFVLPTLYEGVQAYFSGDLAAVVVDEEGEEWSFKEVEDEVITIDRGHNDGAVVPLARLLHPSSHCRLAYLNSLMVKARAADGLFNKWANLLVSRPLEVSELKVLQDELDRTLGVVLNRVRDAFQAPSASVDDFVPFKYEYFSQLVGGEYAETLAALGHQLLKNEVSDLPSLTACLARSSHSTLTPHSTFGKLTTQMVAEYVDGSIDTLDSWSLIGLVEAMAKRPEALGDLEASFKSCIRKLISVLADHKRMALTVALHAMVDVRVAVSGYFYDEPVFRRRLMSLTHAAAIERVALELSVDLNSLAEWAGDNIAGLHCVSLVDMRREPRWSSVLWNGDQLAQELTGRAMTALEPLRAEIAKLDWGSEVFGGDQSLEARRVFTRSALPGPLEGSLALAFEMPTETEQFVLEQVRESSERYQSVEAAAHFSLMARPSSTFMEELLKAAKDVLALDQTDKEEELARLLLELAQSASANRDELLSDLVIQSAASMRLPNFATRIYASLLSCGASESLDPWLDRVAACVQALSQKAEPEDAAKLLSVIDTMIDAQPMLVPRLCQELAGLKLNAGRISSSTQ